MQVTIDIPDPIFRVGDVVCAGGRLYARVFSVQSWGDWQLTGDKAVARRIGSMYGAYALGGTTTNTVGPRAVVRPGTVFAFGDDSGDGDRWTAAQWTGPDVVGPDTPENIRERRAAYKP